MSGETQDVGLSEQERSKIAANVAPPMYERVIATVERIVAARVAAERERANTAAETWIEWGVRRTWGDVGSVAFFERDYRTARNCAKEWPGQLVHRIVTARNWADGDRAALDTPREDQP